jgi:cytochrome oxidase Cu insertion factor (SCO1/SenC/PrrC family)
MRLALPSVLLVTACVATAAVGAWAHREAGAEEQPMSEIAVGAVPGAFALNDQEGQVVRLGQGKDHGWFVLAFYPKASTGG